MTELDTNGYAGTNGVDSHHKSSRPRETSEERRIRKEKEKAARGNETEEERKVRKEKERREREDRHKNETEEERRARKERERKDGKEKRKETDEERAARKEKERKEKEGRKNETEEERKIRKEKERKERDDRHKHETEEERVARKERERKEKEDKKKNETEEERAARKERERKEKDERRKNETEEERAARKEKERNERKNETEEERKIRKEKERKEKEKKKETEEERAARKERERVERKEKVVSPKKEVKDEPMELGDDYFEQEEARANARRKVKEEKYEPEEESQDMEEGGEEDDPEVKHENDSDEDVPLARRKGESKGKKRKIEDDESDDEPLSKKKSKSKKQQKKIKEESEEEDFKPLKKKPKIEKKPAANASSPTKKMTKKEKELQAEKQVWKWWEESEQLPDGVKWRSLEHKGPMFAPDYERLPKHVKFWYDGKEMKLTEETEECATFYGRMLDHDYTTKEVFNKNFFKDWRKIMSDKEKETIRDLQKCDFSEINEHFKKVSEERKARSKEEKKAEKEKNEQIVEEYGFCIIDGHRERIGNFRIEPPGLFRGRGEHPKQGMIKRRTMPEDVIINCSKDSNVPEPPHGRKWKKVQHDNAVTWLASWTENVQGQTKYVMLNPSSKLKGEKDWQKYEKARKLKDKIDTIRSDYMEDMKSKEMRVRQRAVALYFIDKLALRAGNEKDEDQADTVGCCSLRFEHVELMEESNGKQWVVAFDFLGKDSIRYQNEVAVEKRVFKNLKLFMDQKKDGDDLFDRLNTSILNQYLNSLMDGLTAKVFRTYNASFTLQQQLDELTNEEDPVQAKLLSYNRANRAVAILCNHQRAVPKTHDKSMENLQGKIEAKQDAIKEAQKQVKSAKKATKNGGNSADKAILEKKKKTLERLLEQLEKLEIQRTDKDENKTIALGTSKLNYLDPRISVAWCKKHEVPIEKVYNKTQREKFRWAIDMAEADYVF